MPLRLSIPEFGGQLASPVVNAGAQQIDAGWFVNFDALGPVVAIGVTAIAMASAFPTTPASLSLWASSNSASVGAAVLLASLNFASTGGLFVGQRTSASAPNPGGHKFLLMTSVQGTGAVGAPLSYRGVTIRMESA